MWRALIATPENYTGVRVWSTVSANIFCKSVGDGLTTPAYASPVNVSVAGSLGRIYARNSFGYACQGGEKNIEACSRVVNSAATMLAGVVCTGECVCQVEIT